eukprot:scaffold818_cov136-Cylindrotheca_fusiformis.AAC.10
MHWLAGADSLGRFACGASLCAVKCCARLHILKSEWLHTRSIPHHHILESTGRLRRVLTKQCSADQLIVNIRSRSYFIHGCDRQRNWRGKAPCRVDTTQIPSVENLSNSSELWNILRLVGPSGQAGY